jgi:hypothetical protein
MAQRRTWALPFGLLAGYCGLAAATGIAIAAGGTRRPGMALVILAVAVLLLATRMTALTAAGLGVMAWLFYSGFITGRHGDLTFYGLDGVWRLVALADSAWTGVALSWLVAHLRGSHRDVRNYHSLSVFHLDGGDDLPPLGRDKGNTGRTWPRRTAGWAASTRGFRMR